MLHIPAWLQHAITTYGYWAVLVAVGIESLGVPFPGETTLVVAAIFAGTGRPLNIIGVIVAAAAGAILGDNTGYTIGRFGGYALIKRFGHYVRLDEAKLEPAQRFFRQHGDKTVFLGRFVSVLRTWVAFLAGVNRMPWHSFLIWNAAGGIVWAIIYGLLGFFLGRHVALLERIIGFVGIGGVVVAAALIVVLVGAWWVRRRAKGKAAPTPAGQPSVGPIAEREMAKQPSAVPTAVAFASTTKPGSNEPNVPRVRHGDITGARRPFVVRPIARGERGAAHRA